MSSILKRVVCQCVFAMAVVAAVASSAFAQDAKTGKVLWTRSFDRQHYASVVAVGTCLVLTDTKGKVTFVDADFGTTIGMHELAEDVYASPAAGSLIYRSRRACPVLQGA